MTKGACRLGEKSDFIGTSGLGAHSDSDIVVRRERDGYSGKGSQRGIELLNVRFVVNQSSLLDSVDRGWC